MLKIKDHSISKEFFYLNYNPKYDCLETYPIPINLESYYSSDNYISHTDRKKSLIEFAYQIVKKFTLKQKLNLLNNLLPQKGYLLDIGAGTGDFLLIAKKNNWNIQGIEPNEKARKKARKKGLFLKENIQSINQQFDCITMWHSLEHIVDLDEQITFLKNHLVNNGILIIAVPNYKSKDAEIYKEFWAGYDVPRHIWHFSQKSINTLFTSYNFKLINTKPMLFDSFYVSLLSEKYKNGKINYLRGFWNGFISNMYALKNGEYSSLIYIFKNVL